MNPQDPLASLHPLRQPDAVGWWPPAPGWWLLGLLLAGLLVTLCYLILRHLRRTRYRRLARRQQQRLFEAFEHNGDLPTFVSSTNALLKSVALQAWPRRDIAALHGHDWLQFLNTTAGDSALFEADFADASYRADIPSLDAKRLQHSALTWIARHRSAQ